MHVLHYVDSLRLEEGGVVRATLDLTAELARAGAKVTLLTGDATDAPQTWRDDQAAPDVVTIGRSLTPLLRPRTAGADLKRLVSAADLVHLHIPWDPFHPSVVRAANEAGKPYVVSLHGMLDDWCLGGKAFKKHAYLALIGRRLLREAAWLHCTASIEAEQSLRHVPGANAHVEPLIIDSAPFRDLVGPEPARDAFPDAFAGDTTRLLFVGRVHPIKGLATLLDAMALLPTAAPHLLIAGPVSQGHDTELRQQAERLGLGDRVHLLGMVHGNVKQSLYQAADAFVLPSHHENFGIALVEAMMCGAPVLTSKSVNIWPEVEEHGGLVVDHSVEGFATGLDTLLSTRTKNKQSAVSNRERVFDWLEPCRLAKRYLDAYKSTIEST